MEHTLPWKKTTLVDINGVQVLPSLPLAWALNQALRVKAEFDSENVALKLKQKTLEKDYEVLSNENVVLSEKLSALNSLVITLQAANENLEKKGENKEKEVIKVEEANKVMKNRLSVLEKTHFEENNEMELQAKALKQQLKFKDKEAHNLNKKIVNLQDINTNLKSELSQT